MNVMTYVELGWPVLPLFGVRDGKCECGHDPCVSKPGKHPAWRLVPNGLTNASLDTGIVAHWQGRHHGNWGVRAGGRYEDGYLLFLDIDPRNNGDETLAQLEAHNGKLPRTPTQITGGGGQHYVFKSRTPVRCSVVGPGIELKGEGGYVVVEPSVHESGRSYTWDCDASLDIPVAWAPEWLVQSTASPKSRPPTSGEDAKNTFLGVAFEAAGLLRGALRDGKRNVVCPWSAEHSDGRGDGADSSTALLPPTKHSSFGGFKCQHSHCAARTWRDVVDALPSEAIEKARAAYPKDAPPALGILRRTDSWNANRLITWHGDRFRYVGAWEKFLAWDGKRWHQHDVGAVQELAKLSSQRIARESIEQLKRAQQAFEENESDENLEKLKAAKAERAWAATSQNSARLRAMVDVAKSDPDIAVSHDNLCADPWLLNVENGTVDLRSGKLRPHDRSDVITKLAPVMFDPEAKAPTWEAFLKRVMADDEIVSYLKRIIGYALTGVTREHLCAFCYGGGKNGKSTFNNTIRELMGDYAIAAPRGLLMAKKSGDRHPTELATLFGARFVICPEVQKNDELDEALVKDLTGGDAISARRMREDFWTFKPTHKLFMSGNYRPTIRGHDEGIWRRIRLIPFDVTIPIGELDSRLPEKLRAELPGILRWAVEGCLEWQRDGLGEPGTVMRATAAYREESDLLGQFFQERCVTELNAIVGRKDLRISYESWCREMGAAPVGARTIGERLRGMGVTGTTKREGSRVVDAWRGIRFKTQGERGLYDAEAGSEAESGPEIVGSVLTDSTLSTDHNYYSSQDLGEIGADQYRPYSTTPKGAE